MYRGVFLQQTVTLEIRRGNVIEVAAADLRAEVHVAGGFLDRLQSDTLVFDELHRNLRDSPHDDMRSGNLRDRIVAVLRQPFRIERLRALVVENVLETVVLSGTARSLRVPPASLRSSPLTIG